MTKSAGSGTANDAAVSTEPTDDGAAPTELDVLRLNVENAKGKIAKIEALLEDAKASQANAQAELDAAEKGN